MKYSFTDSLTSCSNILEKTFSILESPISNFTITPLISKVDSQIIFINNSLDFNSCTWSLGDENYYLDSILELKECRRIRKESKTNTHILILYGIKVL